MTDPIEVVIVGAGPFGLSIAAHLRHAKIEHRIFGRPMQSWRTMMPRGMLLKSEGFASSLFDPGDSFTLAHYCREVGQPYEDVGLPVPLETFTAYGAAFQKRLVPQLEPTDVTLIRRPDRFYEVTTAAGEKLMARRVIVATGIVSSAYLPPILAGLPPEFVTHTSDHSDLTKFSGRRVAVVGGGSSAVDVAALLHEAGARVEIVARAPSIAFHSPSQEPRPLLQRLLNPRSGLGLGWRSRLCTDAPMIFHMMPPQFRLRTVRRHLGPSSGWFTKEKVDGKVVTHLGVSLTGAEIKNGEVHLQIAGKDGPREIAADHVIAGTGYRPKVQKLSFLADDLRQLIRVLDDSPTLSQAFESSLPGLYFVGLASANAFGPLMRFAYGAGYTARRLTRHLARRAA
jgi:cation diffusion facilitator CzcD-associated flavoprotein CzcO